MLSPHEFAALMLIEAAPEPADLSREDVEALIERRLVKLEKRATGYLRLHLTAHGQSILSAMTHYRRR